MKVLGLLVLVLGMGTNTWARCEESYVPPHDFKLLVKVKKWATGAAFAEFAEKAGFLWDQKAYVEAVPDQALFNFGLATGTSCLQMDLVSGYLSYLYALSNYYLKTQTEDPSELEETFSEFFLRHAKKAGILNHLIYSNDWA